MLKRVRDVSASWFAGRSVFIADHGGIPVLRGQWIQLVANREMIAPTHPSNRPPSDILGLSWRCTPILHCCSLGCFRLKGEKE